MQLLTVAFNAIFAPCLYQARKPKNSVFSSLLYQAAKPKIVIPGYIVGKKKKKQSVSLRPQSFFMPLSCVKQCRQDARRINQALPPASGAREVISTFSTPKKLFAFFS